MSKKKFTTGASCSYILIIFSVALIFTGTNPVCAQEIDNVDVAFEQARQLAYEGNYDEAEDLLMRSLEQSPDYHGIRVFLARMYSWTERYSEGLEQTGYVLDRVPHHRQALEVHITLQLWNDEPEEALQTVSTAIESHSSEDDFWVQKARAELALENYGEAHRALDQAEELNPSNADIPGLRTQVRTESLRYTITLAGNHDRFSEVFNPATTSYFQVSRSTRLGSVIGRVNYRNRFGSYGFQPEIDWYPPIRDGIYAYLNAGVTTSSLFPAYRLGAEPYFRLPAGFEVSAGIRFMSFNAGNVLIYTLSATKYYGNWMFTVRPFFTPGQDGVSNSYNFIARRYLSSADSYFDLSAGFGFSPEERFFQDMDQELFFFRSQYAGISMSREFRYNLTGFGGFYYARQEKTFNPGDYYNTYTFNAGRQVKL